MTTNWDDMAVVGRIARAQGHRGQVIIDPVTDFPEERFKAGSVVFVSNGQTPEALTIEAVRFHRGRPILSLAGIETMNEAEALAGKELRVGVDTLQPLPAGTFYHHDLIGCSIETPRGVTVGRVTKVEGAGAASRLVVKSPNGEVLIPMVEGI